MSKASRPGKPERASRADPSGEGAPFNIKTPRGRVRRNGLLCAAYFRSLSGGKYIRYESSGRALHDKHAIAASCPIRLSGGVVGYGFLAKIYARRL